MLQRHEAEIELRIGKDGFEAQGPISAVDLGERGGSVLQQHEAEIEQRSLRAVAGGSGRAQASAGRRAPRVPPQGDREKGSAMEKGTIILELPDDSFVEVGEVQKGEPSAFTPGLRAGQFSASPPA